MEISQSKLKYCDALVLEMFALQVLNFINPNFENIDFNDPHSDASLSKNKIIDFATKSILTPSEFLNALDLVPRGKLTTIEDRPNGEVYEKPLILFSRIDSKNLIEIETAYIRFKNLDKLYEKGKNDIRSLLNPPPQLTDEQKEIEREKWLISEWERLKKDENVRGGILFYDLIKEKGLENVKLSFVEIVLDRFKPETVEGSIGGVPKFTKNDVKTYFKERLVDSYMKIHDLKNVSKTEFIEHWKLK